MTFARRVDNTHASIRDGLREAGFSVRDMARVGKDFPDLLIGKHGIDAKVECKTENRRRNGVKTAAQLLSTGQKDFADEWRGSPVIVAYCLQDALFGFHLLLKRHGRG